MKKIFFLVVILTLSLLCRAQERKYSTFYYQRATLFEELPVTSSDIIFLGNSITNGAEWAELLGNGRNCSRTNMSKTVESAATFVWEYMTVLMLS